MAKQLLRCAILVPYTLWLAAPLASAASSDASEAKALSFQLQARLLLKLPEVNFSAVKSLPGGDLVFLAQDRWGIHRFVRASESLASFGLHSVPESARASIQVKGDFTVDGAGSVYVPANWFEWQHGSTPKAGVFVFGADGRYLRTIEFAMQCSPEKIAVDSNGNILVLSLDAAYLKGREKRCFLLHKFTKQGILVGSFSACPMASQNGKAEFAVPGAALSALREEADRGHVWIQDGQIYHVLPASRLLRVFDREGKPVREVSLTPPESATLLAGGGMTAAPNNDQVWRIISRPDGTYLVEWLHSEAAGTSGQRRTTFLALHDSDGRPLTSAVHPPVRPSIPVAADSQGRIIFLLLKWASADRPEMEMAPAVLSVR